MKTFIKQIKSATSKAELQAITYEAFIAENINGKQYGKLTKYAVCREIELGVSDIINHYPSKEVALEEAQKEFRIKY